MKTLLSFSIAGWLSVGLMGCSGDDGTSPFTPPEGSPETLDESRANIPATVTDPPATDTPTANPPISEQPPPVVAPPSIVETPPTPVSLVPHQELDWRACGQFENRNLECAEVEVPIDYDAPDGETLPIAVRRILANPLEPHRGALLFNPGGPGGKGIDSSLSFFQGGLFDAIAPGFDIIGFDPRGVGASGERGCGIYPPDMYPGATQTEQARSLEDDVLGTRAFGDACEQEWGPLFRKLGSNNVVRDMDEIRKALNEPVMNFYGGSYGTRLGALYAHTFPGTTGRIVLDASVHPRASFVELVRGQFHQAIALHEIILGACETGDLPCPPNARDVFEQIRSNARQRGIEAAVINVWRSSLDSPLGLQSLLDALAAEAADPGGDWILSFVAGGGSGIGFVPFAGVTCSDDAAEPPTIEQLQSLVAEFQEASPLFANDAAGAAMCTGWPATRDPVPLPTASEAPPLLVIGGTLDLRTPFEWAQAMTETLGNATLLTSNHFGHGALRWGSDCVRQTIRAYLTSGSMPASGAVCP